MRTRKEIEGVFHLNNRYVQLAILEVLLDIREILQKQLEEKTDES